ncbi:alpha/beta hydrolase [Shivajiella indica]|uniref:Alpha/beta hydrolase n=1 Tax=Shivajiella indica TaxID=872115 RepID=A0ABW5BCZ5_9BACT
MKNLFLFVILACLTGTLFAQVDTVDIYSQALKKSLKAAVVKPQGYEHRESAYPTVYLLHGGAGKFSDWHLKTTEDNLLINLSNQYGIIIVTPSVGPLSYYWDSPNQDSVRYETYMIQELIPFIDQKYKTLKMREGRAIAGLSMGGHGALMLSAKHPELFTAAGSMSGVMNIDVGLWKVEESYANSVNQRLEASIGTFNREAPFSPFTVVGLVDRMKENGIFLLIDCGVDDFLINTNRQIHQLLLENGTPHEYTERPGAHTWEYWTEALPFHMLFIHQVFKKNGIY